METKNNQWILKLEKTFDTGIEAEKQVIMDSTKDESARKTQLYILSLKIKDLILDCYERTN